MSFTVIKLNQEVLLLQPQLQLCNTYELVLPVFSFTAPLSKRTFAYNCSSLPTPHVTQAGSHVIHLEILFLVDNTEQF